MRSDKRATTRGCPYKRVLFRVSVQGAVGHYLVMFLLLVLLGYGLRRGGVLTDEKKSWSLCRLHQREVGLTRLCGLLCHLRSGIAIIIRIWEKWDC